MSHYFVAIGLTSRVQTYISEMINDKKNKLLFKKWVHPQDYHITLAFLGQAEEARIEELRQKLTIQLKDIAAFSLALSSIGTFGQSSRPRIYWLGVHHSDALMQLQEQVAICARRVGFQLEERSYSPHITIARNWIGKHDYQLENIDSTPFSWEVDEIAIYQTNLNQTPKYEAIARIPISYQ